MGGKFMKENALELLKEQIKNEPFANYMGIKLLDIAPGYGFKYKHYLYSASPNGLNTYFGGARRKQDTAHCNLSYRSFRKR
jgi:hypothetical protein